jgi:hypothetical protein
MTGKIKPARDSSGRFLPGVSGNPSGGPVKDPEAVKLAYDATPDAVRTIIKIMTAKGKSSSNRDKLDAAKTLLAYGIGMPRQKIDVNQTIGILDVLRELNPDRPPIEGETDNPALEGESSEVRL